MRVRTILVRWCVAILLLGVLVAAPAGPALATGGHVTICAGSGVGSLPFAVLTATAGDTIVFDVDCPPESPIVLGGTITFNKDLTLDATGHSVALSGTNAHMIFNIPTGLTLSFIGLTLQNADTFSVFNYGSNVTLRRCTVTGSISYGTNGTIYNSGGTLTLESSTVSGNTTSEGMPDTLGGTVGNRAGVLFVTDSTISGNSLVGSASTPVVGGGIYNRAGGTVVLTSSTISGNSVSGLPGFSGGGGVYSEAGSSVSIVDTIIAGNSGPQDPDVYGAFTSGGHNLIGNAAGGGGFIGSDLLGVDPQLGVLANNGGPTRTMAITAASPAYNAGGATCPAGVIADQRGVPRPQDLACDIGAFELVTLAPPTISAISPPSGATVGGTLVTITGTHFLAGAGVSFGGVAATNVAVGNSTTITATAPAAPAGTVGVRVTNPNGGTATLAGAFTYGVVTFLPVQRPTGTPSGIAPTPNPDPRPSEPVPSGTIPAPLPPSR